MKSNIRNIRPGRSKQKGFSLIEMGIVLAIAAIVLYGIYSWVSRVQNQRVANDEAQNYNMMVSDVRTKFGAQGTFTGISPAALINLGLVPKTMINGAAIRSGWNTPVAVAAVNLNGTAGDGVQFTYTVPREQCSDFVTGAAGASARVTVGGTMVKDIPGGVNTVNVGTLATQCAANTGGNVAILLAQGR